MNTSSKTTPDSTQTFDGRYFQWLIESIPENEDYHMLLYLLFLTDYYYIADIPIDGCRGEDGLALRNAYIDQYHIDKSMVDFYTRSCTVLEWLLAMAKRCEDDIMFNENEGDRIMLWFWSMLDNMGLSKYKDSSWNDSTWGEISEHLNDILSRRFPSDGAGSPFPLSETDVDVSTCDWWKALNLWLTENFSDEFDCDIV